MDSVGGMRILVRVVDAGSFSGAARQLGVAPSSVSRQINDLEEQLGVRLFHRTTRQLSLTEAGHIYYERAGSILIDVDEAKLAISQLGSPSGILRVTLPSAIGRELVVSVLPKFLALYPGIKIVMSIDDQIVDMVERGLDVGIRIGQLKDSTIKARRIGDSRRVVCASPEYIRRAGRPGKPADLSSLDCITWRDHPGPNVWKFRGADGQQDVRVSGNFFARNADAIIAAAVAGLGFCLLPDWNLGMELRQKQLEVVLRDYDAVPKASPVWAVHTHQRHVPPKIRVFIDFLAARFAGTGYS
ncbi:MAG: LysR substrate-binding domain-containing protein [Gammaproteobacteria bacterium]